MESLARALSERYEAMQVCHTFKVGDIVTWKPGLSNRRYPKNGAPAVVMEVLETSVLDRERDSGSPYFREPLDVLLGVFAEDEACRACSSPGTSTAGASSPGRPRRGCDGAAALAGQVLALA